MFWIILIVVVVIVALGLRYLRYTNSASGMAKTTARTMLRSLTAIQGKHQYPINTDAGKLELYRRVLQMRPSYNDEMIDELLAKAVRLSKPMFGEPEGVSFNNVVYLVVKNEYTKQWHREPTKSEREQILTGIDSGLSK